MKWSFKILLSQFSMFFFSILFLANSSSLASLSLSLFLNFLSQIKESVCVCVCVSVGVSSIRALCTACALISRSQTGGTCQLESNTSLSNTELMDCWVRELKNKSGWLRQEHPFTHHLSISLSLSLWKPVGDWSPSRACVCVYVWVLTEKSINQIIYSIGELNTVESLLVHLHTFCSHIDRCM